MYSFSYSKAENDFVYTFDCYNGNQYKILFASISDIFNTKKRIGFDIYFLNIISTLEKPIFDINTSKTIAAITIDFFQRNDKGFVFYYPENKDGRDYLRTIAFDRWFNNHSKEHYSKVDYTLNFEDSVLKAGLIFLSLNPEKEKGQKIVTDFIRDLNRDKDNTLY